MPDVTAPVNYWDSHEAHDRIAEHLERSHPLVRSAINRRISGDPDVRTTTWLQRKLEPHPRLGATMSVGCGMGVTSVTSSGSTSPTGSSASSFRRSASTMPAAPPTAQGGSSTVAADAWADRVAADATSTRSSSTPRSTISTASTRWRPSCAGPQARRSPVPRRIRRPLARRMEPRRRAQLELALLPPAKEACAGSAQSGRRSTTKIRPRQSRHQTSCRRLPRSTLEQRDYGGNLLSVIYGNLRCPPATACCRQGGGLPGGSGGVPPGCGRTAPLRPPRSTEVGKQSHRACRPAE